MGALRNKRKEFKQYAKNHTKNYLYASEFSSDLPSAKMFEHIDIDKMCDVFLDFIGIKMLLTSSMKDLFENFMCSHCWVRHKDYIKI